MFCRHGHSIHNTSCRMIGCWVELDWRRTSVHFGRHTEQKGLNADYWYDRCGSSFRRNTTEARLHFHSEEAGNVSFQIQIVQLCAIAVHGNWCVSWPVRTRYWSWLVSAGQSIQLEAPRWRWNRVVIDATISHRAPTSVEEGEKTHTSPLYTLIGYGSR